MTTMAVKAHWDRDTTRCCKEGCGRARAEGSVLCRYHVDSFIARCEQIANAHTPAEEHTPKSFRWGQDTDTCPRCGQAGARVDHGRAGC